MHPVNGLPAVKTPPDQARAICHSASGREASFGWPESLVDRHELLGPYPICAPPTNIDGMPHVPRMSPPVPQYAYAYPSSHQHDPQDGTDEERQRRILALCYY